MGESSRSKGVETREFWEEAIRLWGDSGLSVREFCRREGLNEHSFYSWRRALLPKETTADAGPASPDKDGGQTVSARRRQRKRKRIVGVDVPEETTPVSFVELVTPGEAVPCCCTLELENPAGAKMRIELRSSATPDLAAISQSFWNGWNRPS